MLSGQPNKEDFKQGYMEGCEQNPPATELTIQRGKDQKKQLNSNKGPLSDRIAISDPVVDPMCSGAVAPCFDS